MTLKEAIKEMRLFIYAYNLLPQEFNPSPSILQRIELAANKILSCKSPSPP
ncbi:hypothetical protein E308F_29640 [Moorella sp. E308F]|uniref:hypothetical protein n=1 Tax=Moorella sp. E308F TaxID=2572682 RepID=UPI0010FFB5F0|nr:hypothetical protein [Moorella sp. E308F]GEA16718.1 hypothetical protein E308F_29640 [Moorella sp. E308F]